MTARVPARHLFVPDHQKLRGFELADQLAIMAYLETRGFPASEVHGLRSQIRRAAVSVASNIVEGCARTSQAGRTHVSLNCATRPTARSPA